jgi:phospholipase D
MSNIILKLLKNSFIKKNFKNKSILYVLLLGLFTGMSYVEFNKRTWYTQTSNLNDINICFTPPAGCADLIAREISQAKKEVYVQAYSFTSQKIIDQLIKIHKQKINIHILVDKSNLTDLYSKISLLQNSGIKVKIDKVSGIAHNKVIIIDGEKVITGSFNFTNDADKRNVENVVLIKDKKIAAMYIQNWQNRYNAN